MSPWSRTFVFHKPRSPDRGLPACPGNGLQGSGVRVPSGERENWTARARTADARPQEMVCALEGLTTRERGTVLCVIPRAPDALAAHSPAPATSRSPCLSWSALNAGVNRLRDGSPDFNNSAGSSARILSGSRRDRVSEKEDHLLRVCREKWVAQRGRGVIPEQEERR